ncbi:MAG: ribonuclease III domain-containing protein [Eubacteriales bacterium]|nr:ribonuclease III domain-containing protein [Eubacteriales bacterium]
MEKSIDESFAVLTAHFTKSLAIEPMAPEGYSSLSLALIGDAVYDLAARYYVMSGGDRSVNQLHRMKSKLVRAEAQAVAADRIADGLSVREMAVYKRGRNTKTHTAAKNADIISYRKATGFEALVGWLFLAGRYERMMEIIREALRMDYE